MSIYLKRVTSFDASIEYGMRTVAEMSGQTLGYDIRAAKVVRPHEFAGKTYIGPVLISIGLITFIAAAFYNVFRSYSKNFLWKFKGIEFELPLCLIFGYIDLDDKMRRLLTHYNLSPNI